jgi:hypothetical protein
MLKYTRSTISNIDTKTKAIEETSTLGRIQAERASQELKELKTSQTAMASTVTRLVHICAGMKVGIEDFRRAVEIRNLEMKQYLDRIRHSQERSLSSISQSSWALVNHVNKMEQNLRQLLAMFGGFSATVLNLL